MAKAITPREENYAQWYVDIVTNAQLADYSPVKGSMVIRPRGYALWEQIQSTLDRMFKETGHQNAYFPMLIPESFLKKEAEHVEGFSPELAVVTHAGGAELEEPLVLRPTSETIIWYMYKKWIQSHRDLPLLLNQWANVMRWEKRTRLFLRTTEFLWQEGHTAHASEEEARQETQKMLEVYKNFAEEYMALGLYAGRKSENEKFAGAVETYSIEALVQDKRAVQAGTSHFLGQNFAKAFDVTYQNTQGTLEHVWATSWGVSTRLVGTLIMTHSDDKGLVVPPKLAANKVVIIPIFKAKNKDEVLPVARELQNKLSAALGNIPQTVLVDDDETNSPGWKFAEWELRGVPVRIEMGPRDIADQKVIVARRDTGEKQSVSFDALTDFVVALLDTIQQDMRAKSVKFRDDNTFEMKTFDDLKTHFANEGGNGFIAAPWAGSSDDEDKIKEQTKATIRFLEPIESGTCFYTGKPATHKAFFARAY